MARPHRKCTPHRGGPSCPYCRLRHVMLDGGHEKHRGALPLSAPREPDTDFEPPRPVLARIAERLRRRLPGLSP